MASVHLAVPVQLCNHTPRTYKLIYVRRHSLLACANSGATMTATTTATSPARLFLTCVTHIHYAHIYKYPHTAVSYECFLHEWAYTKAVLFISPDSCARAPKTLRQCVCVTSVTTNRSSGQSRMARPRMFAWDWMRDAFAQCTHTCIARLHLMSAHQPNLNRCAPCALIKRRSSYTCAVLPHTNCRITETRQPATTAVVARQYNDTLM